MNASIQFLGGAGTVTGSKYLLRRDDQRILIDCGLFQGLKSLRLRNWSPFPVPPSEIDAIVLTHAHIDHSGYIPKIVKEGFKGKIYCTPATRDLCEILLPDAGYLMEEESAYLNKIKKSKHDPALPLYSQADANLSLRHLQATPFDETVALAPGLQFNFQRAGHIFGAASAILSVNGRKIAFSGDIGRLKDPIFPSPALLPQVDFLVMESTYGDRLHEDSDLESELAGIINETCKNGGVVLIPAFAVGRAQILMYYIAKLEQHQCIPSLPVYLNSPMATNVSTLLKKYRKEHLLTEAETDRTCDAVRYVRSFKESKELNLKRGPMIIIAASGMLTGGRILHHMKAFSADARNTILLTGYQAPGTRGSDLEKGARKIKIHGSYYPVAARVKTLRNVSAHADYQEMLTWLAASAINPKKVYLTHGEPAAADGLRRRISENLGWHCEIPELGCQEELR